MQNQFLQKTFSGIAKAQDLLFKVTAPPDSFRSKSKVLYFIWERWFSIIIFLLFLFTLILLITHPEIALEGNPHLIR